MYRQSQSAESPVPGMLKPSPPTPTLSEDSSFQVRPPTISEHSAAVYTDYVARATGNVAVVTDQYQAYVDCQLDIFPVLGWEKH